MSQEIEIEFKNLLTKEEFYHLLASYPFPKESQSQTNYYFETRDHSLRKKQCALRIRKKAGTYRLTLKEPHPSGILETHDVLTEKEALAWIKEDIIKKSHTTTQLNKLDISPKNLLYYGNLTTERREINFNSVLLVLDYSTFNGHSDYELELEAPNREIGLETFNSILRKHNIFKKNTPTKIQRFFSTIPN